MEFATKAASGSDPLCGDALKKCQSSLFDPAMQRREEPVRVMNYWRFGSYKKPTGLEMFSSEVTLLKHQDVSRLQGPECLASVHSENTRTKHMPGKPWNCWGAKLWKHSFGAVTQSQTSRTTIFKDVWLYWLWWKTRHRNSANRIQ